MGACVSDKKKTSKKETEIAGKRLSEIKLDQLNDQSMQIGLSKININDDEEKILNYITQGSLNKIEELFDKGEIKLNEYVFGGTETILHKAVCRGNSAKIVEFLLLKGAKVDTIEIVTDNTPLFFACVDLKVDIVEVILNFSPNIEHLNKGDENALQYLNNTFYPKKGYGKTITPEDKKKYDAIVEKIENYKRKSKYTENLDNVNGH